MLPGEKEQAKIYTRRLVGVVYGMLFVVAGGMSLFSKPLVGLFALSEEGASLAIRLMLFHNLCAVLVHPLAFAIAHAFRAASDVNHTMIVAIFSMWVFRVGGAFLFAKVLEMGVFGVWLGMACDWVFRAILFSIRYLSGRWLTKYKKLG